MGNILLKSSVLRAILFSLLCGFSFSLLSCGEAEPGDNTTEAKKDSGAVLAKTQTAQDAYGQIVAAVETRKYGGMYDMMDSANRHYTEMWFDLNLKQLDVMDSAERAGWSQFKNISDTRNRFIRLVEVTPAMRDRFKSGYKILSVDTVVAVVTQHLGSSPQITYFRWEDGGYKYSAPPESKIAPAAVQLPAENRPDAVKKGDGSDNGANKR